MRNLRRILQIPVHTFKIIIPRYSKASGKIKDASMSIVLPHEVAEQFDQDGKLSELFGTSQSWELFWHCVRDETWFKEHLLRRQIEQSPWLYAPYVLFIDDAPVTRRVGRSIRAVSLVSPLALNKDPVTGRIALCITVNDEPMRAMIERKAKATISWSCRAIAFNVHPTRGPDEEALDTQRASKAGTPVMRSGVRLAFVGMTGDLDYFAKDFEMPWSFLSDQCCWCCEARMSGPLHNFGDASLTASWTNTARSLESYIEYVVGEGSGMLNPLLGIPGWSNDNLYEDVLHADALGVRAQANGSTIHQLAHLGTWGEFPTAGSWDSRLNIVLTRAYNDFQGFLKRHGLKSSQPKFKALTLSLHKMTDFPNLKGKGKNMITVSLWLAEKTEALMSDDDDLSKFRFSLHWGLKRFWDLMHNMRPRVCFNAAEHDELETIRAAILLSFYHLHQEAASRGVSLYNMTPKFHVVDHMFRRAKRTGISPHMFWTFASEDWIGSMAVSSQKTHGATMQSSVIERWLVCFWSHYYNV